MHTKKEKLRNDNGHERQGEDREESQKARELGKKTRVNKKSNDKKLKIYTKIERIN